MGSIPGGRHGWCPTEESGTRAGVYFVPDNIHCRRRLRRLMGTEAVDLTSARYMDALAEKVLQDYEEKLLEREKELAQNEIRRERDLIIRGLMPDPNESKKRQSQKGSWGSLRRHRAKNKKDPSSGRPLHPDQNMPDGMSSYQQKIFCSSNFRDFTFELGSFGGPSSDSLDSRRASSDGPNSQSTRK